MILLDTCVYLYAAYDPARLSARARRLLIDRTNVLVWSVVSTWEIALKDGRSDMPSGVLRDLPEGLDRLGARILPVEQAHALRVASLPKHHEDPFDRLLVAQALHEGLTLVTSDQKIPLYRAEGLTVAW